MSAALRKQKPVSHERLSNIHAHDCDVRRKVSNTDGTGKSDDDVANSAKTLTESDKPAPDRPLIREVGASDCDTVRQNVRRRRQALGVD
jgi:hypothetical protein